MEDDNLFDLKPNVPVSEITVEFYKIKNSEFVWFNKLKNKSINIYLFFKFRNIIIDIWIMMIAK